ncbi:three-prime repair exonuclease 1-like isoform X1 [Styela clava]
MDFPALKSEITALQMSLFAMEEENLWIADTATACQDLDAPDQHKMHETTLDAIDYSMESLYLRYLKKRMPMETYTAEQYATCLMQLVDSIPDQFINVVSIMKFSDVLPRDQKVARALFPTQSTENGEESADQNEDPDRQANEHEYDIRTFVFLDLETTGLDTTTDNITELCLIAVDREQITELGNEVVEHEYGEFPKVPRVQDKLNILIDPLSMIPNEVSRITKIDKENLEVRNKKPFSYETSMILRSFLDRQAHPICLVAHNGDAFDYLILNNHLDRVKADQTIWKEIYCADSLTGVRELRQPCERRPNGLQYLMKEVGVHHSQLLPHSAEGDTIALMVVVKLFPQNLPMWLDQHKRRFK